VKTSQERRRGLRLGGKQPSKKEKTQTGWQAAEQKGENSDWGASSRAKRRKLRLGGKQPRKEEKTQTGGQAAEKRGNSSSLPVNETNKKQIKSNEF